MRIYLIIFFYKAKRTAFPKSSIKILKTWYESNKDHPYASWNLKQELSELTNLSVKQVHKWLINERFKNKASICTCESCRKENE